MTKTGYLCEVPCFFIDIPLSILYNLRVLYYISKENDNKEEQMNNLSKSERTSSTLGLVQLALFSAIIIIMAFTPFIGYIPLGFTRATIIHIPVIIGSIMLGPKKGGFLGGVFGLTSLINNTINPTVTSFAFSPFYSLGSMHGNFASLIICLVPRILVGILPYYVYKWVMHTKNGDKPSSSRQIISLGIAGVVGSLTNTLLVMNLIFVFFKDAYASVNSVSADTVYYFILSIIGINGVPEAIVAGIITIALGKILLKKYVKSKDMTVSQK